MAEPSWLLFLPQLPASPSRLRVLVWRRLRAAGVVGLQSGVWVLPRRSEQERFLVDLVREVERQGGTAAVFAASPLDPALTERIFQQSSTDRDREYAEFRERCAALLAELDKETEQRKFTFAELEENEQDLHKLAVWLAKITARDFFGAPGAAGAREAFALCQQRLARYAETLYASEGLAPEDLEDADRDGGVHPTLLHRPESDDAGGNRQ
jgi:hypothetical protein